MLGDGVRNLTKTKNLTHMIQYEFVTWHSKRRIIKTFLLILT